MIDLVSAYDEKWDEYIDNFNNDNIDIYYTKEYCRLYECENSKAYMFVYKEENNSAIYPFLLTAINVDGYEGYFDIETPYGYGGPLVQHRDIGFINRFEENFRKFCLEKNIIAEFIRFHPLLDNYIIFSKNIEVYFNRNTILIDLKKSKEQIWNEDIQSKNRNMIRKAKKNGLVVEASTNTEEFISIYKKTMEKVNATSYYSFSSDYYEQLFKDCHNKLFVVKKEDKIIASAVFMGYKSFFHYHLAGSLEEYLKFSPNNLLLWEVIEYAKDNGYKYFHLGGGLSSSLDDNLYKFKKKFSSTSCKFYIGKRIHNEEIYNELINLWSEKTKKQPTMLLQYRELN